ncbi:hypothetical protein SAMN04488576_10431 [Bacillus sp. cl25]|nr:hypothetical protein BA201_10095 [Bacillus cereus]SDH76195.1 hypothetical protein SAMN04488578_10331 [Bacillus sp. cl96]SEA23789.1 hypothetical protein SAMN04488575_10331 [Bacillus sp. cl115]SHJ46334.1 hypothetical protein SAMN04488576_10431 [Bacillus sp. cl25]
MNYYQVNVNFIENGEHMETQQCVAMKGNPVLAAVQLRGNTERLVRESIEPLGGTLNTVRTRKVSRKYFESNKELVILEGGH